MNISKTFNQTTCLLALLLIPAVSRADEVHLKNGVILNGTAVQVTGLNAAMAGRNAKGPIRLDSFWLVDDGVRQFFVHRLLVDQIIEEEDLAQKVIFELEHLKTNKKKGPGIVGGFSGAEPFNKFGRRTVILTTKDGPTPIVQGITKLRPDYFQLEGITHQWEYALDTKTLPSEILMSLIEQSSDRTDPSERKATVTFFLQADMLTEAQRELDRIAEEFPELEDWAKEYRQKIAEANARSGINEVQRRRLAGQHQLAYLIAKKAPADEVSATVFREAQDIISEYDSALMNSEEIKLSLDMLQSVLKDKKQAERLRSMRATLVDELRYENIERLNPYLRAQLDNTLSAEQKLALAYSGWILGEANASLDLDEAILIWEARFLVLEFLRNSDDPLLDDELITKLTDLEYVSMQRIVQMIPLLPAPQQGPILPPADIVERDVPVGTDDSPTKYSLMLPPEYSPYREYPLLVVLRSAGGTYEKEIQWWAGDKARQGWAQRRGYIVIAPHYTDETTSTYGGNTTAHEVVINSIKDLQKRYRVDSSRVFLAGHGMGADACLDIGMSRFDWFAGVIPITGECGRICNYYSDNGPDLGWYLVNGQRDRATLDTNAGVFNSVMKQGRNVIYLDYKNRGYESYFEEQERIFEWMQLQRRPQLSELKEWEAKTMRLSEDQFHWVDAHRFRSDLFPVDIYSSKRAKMISGMAKLNNNIHVQVPGSGATVWLSPELVDFNDRVRVTFNRRRVSSDFVQPSMKTLLERLRETGDRQRLYWAKLEL
ncbi:hypothetical protein OAH05_01940 [bacterium]|nr:hypothetical protein [bacterium]